MSVCTHPLFRLSHVRHNAPLLVAVTRAYAEVRGFPPPTRFKTLREATSVHALCMAGHVTSTHQHHGRSSWSRVHRQPTLRPLLSHVASSQHSESCPERPCTMFHSNTDFTGLTHSLSCGYGWQRPCGVGRKAVLQTAAKASRCASFDVYVTPTSCLCVGSVLFHCPDDLNQ